jgi:hypothetical protein
MVEIELGSAFLIDTPPHDRHLYIVIATVSKNNYLLVNTTTSNKQIDPVKDCIIDPGEGIPDFIVCRSTIAYKYAREFRQNQIQQIMNKGKCTYCGKFLEEEVYRIQEKGASSKSLPKKYKDVLEKALREREFNKYLNERFGRRFG